MAAGGRAMALLRQVSTILNEDLNDIDLVVLKAATVAAPNSQVVVQDANVISQWARIIDSVAQPLVSMSKDVKVMQTYFESRVKQNKRTRQMLYTTSASVACAGIVLLASLLSTSEDYVQVGTITGVVLSLFIAYICMVRVWLRMMDEQLDKIDFLYGPSAPVMSMLVRYKLTLADKVIIQLVYAVRLGRTDIIATILQKVANGEWNSSVPNCGKNVTDRDYDCTFPLDTCVPIDALPSTAEMVSKYCANTLRDMADRLQQIKTTIDTFYRPKLWKCVAQGVDSVRDVIEAGRDARLQNDTRPDLTRDSVRSFITREVAPILSIDASEVRFLQFPPLPLPFTAFMDGVDGEFSASRTSCWRKAIDTPNAQGALYDDKAQVCRLISDLPAVTMIMPFAGVPDKQGRLLVKRKQSSELGSNKGGPVDLMICGVMADGALSDAIPLQSSADSSKSSLSNVSDACMSNKACSVATAAGQWKLTDSSRALVVEGFADSSPSSTTTITNKDASLYDFLKADPGGPMGLKPTPDVCIKANSEVLYNQGNVANVIRDMSTELAKSLFVLMQRDGFRVSLKTNRVLLDTTLEQFYGTDLYNGSVKAQIDLVLFKLDKLVGEEFARLSKDGPDRYVTVQRLLAKLRAMTPDEYDQLQDKMKNLLECSKNHLANFPAYKTDVRSDVLRLMVVYGIFVIGIGFAVFSLITYKQYVTESIKFPTLMQRLLLGMCVFLVSVVITETIGAKSKIRGEHNSVVQKDNAASIQVGATQALRALDKLRLIIDDTKSSATNTSASVASMAPVPPETAQTMELATSFRRGGQLLVEAFEKCNEINMAQPDLPFPTIEITLNTLIFLGFLALLAFAAYRISPIERFENIRQLLDIRSQILRGDAPPSGSVVRVLKCCTPDNAAVVDIMIWFVVIMLLRIGVLGAIQAQDQFDLYKESINAEEDCV